MWRVGKPIRIVDIEITKDGDFRAWRLERLVTIVLDRWSSRSSWLAELGKRYRVQMNFEVPSREIFIQMS